MGNPQSQGRYREALRVELTQFDGKIESLRQQIAHLQGPNVEEASTYQSYLDALHLKRRAIEMKLEQVGTTDDGLWDDFQAGLEDVWNDLKLTFTNATEEFEAGQRLKESRQDSET